MELKIDQEFKSLIRPLYRQEYLQLEENLLKYGCQSPLITWRGIIIDGHNRYEICNRHGISFETEEMYFEFREEVIAWICENQLGRRNLSEESRKYLIGMQYEAEKTANEKKNPIGNNQYSSPGGDMAFSPVQNVIATESRNKTAKRIGEANHISHGTVQKYGLFTRAVKRIQDKEPDLAEKILAGKYKISHNEILKLAEMNPDSLKAINQRIENNTRIFAGYQMTRGEINNPSIAGTSKTSVPKRPSVKDMPDFDPDAEITGLILTIPSWSSSINRIKKESNLEIVSMDARQKLREALGHLLETINEMLNSI